jgi:dTDP-4-amino-4,6-dideoxygalactose transaminase
MSANGKIPFLDLITPHEELEEELCEVFRTALSRAAFIGGPMVERFERDFAAFCDVEHCVGVGSGTDAVRFALMAAGVAAGEIVITVPNTFIATTEAISQAGALPDFVDIDERSYNMAPENLRGYLEQKCSFDRASGQLIQRASGRRVAAIVPVHLYGQPADMDPILELAARYDLVVVEDACQAHGAQYYSRREQRWQRAGSMGTAAAFSFYPGKNLGACGEGGAVTTGDAEVARRIRMLRDHGQAQKYYHDLEGYNGRLDSIQAGILKVKLGHLAAWNEQRRHIAREYRKAFLVNGSEVGLPSEPAWSNPIYHLYVVRVANRTELQRHLTEAGIDTGIHYPVPLHLQKAYARLNYKPGDFPVAERASCEILSLPMYPGLTSAQVSRVACEVSTFTRKPAPPAKVLALGAHAD